MIPPVGIASSAYELATGQNFITGASVSPLFAIAGMTPWGRAGRKVDRILTFDWKRAGHIFSPSKGHLHPRSGGSQGRTAKLFESLSTDGRVNQNVLNNAQKGKSEFTGYSRDFKRGQVWIHTRNGKIINAGVNRLGEFR